MCQEDLNSDDEATFITMLTALCTASQHGLQVWKMFLKVTNGLIQVSTAWDVIYERSVFSGVMFPQQRHQELKAPSPALLIPHSFC